MKREFLKNLELSDAVVDAIMAEYGKNHQNAAAAAEERDALRQQVQAMEGQLQQAQGYQERCAKLEQQLNDASYGFCIRRAMDGLKFSSKSAGEAFASALKAKKLPVENEVLQGFDVFVEEYRRNDPDAFAKNQTHTPMFVRGGSGSIHDADGSLRAAFGL